jgi:hypothetical protein
LIEIPLRIVDTSSVGNIKIGITIVFEIFVSSSGNYIDKDLPEKCNPTRRMVRTRQIENAVF